MPRWRRSGCASRASSSGRPWCLQQGSAATASKGPAPEAGGALAEADEPDATDGSDTDVDDMMVRRDGESGSEEEPAHTDAASHAKRHATRSRVEPPAAVAAAAAAAAASEDVMDDTVEVEMVHLGAYMAAQQVGTRWEKAPSDVTGCNEDTKRLASAAVCCWRKNPFCSKS